MKVFLFAFTLLSSMASLRPAVAGADNPPIILPCMFGCQMSGTTCQQFSCDFEDDRFDLILARQDAGPGTLDTATGIWSWRPTPADTGQFVVVVSGCDKLSPQDCGQMILTVIISPPQPPVMSSGCDTDVLLTDQTITAQMGTAVACDDYVWSMSQFKGPVTGATCAIDNAGLINFATTVPGAYEYRVFVSNGVATDSCVHAFIVHGGAGCCVAGRGNVDGAGGVDLSDLSRLVAYMYSASTVLPCWDEANITGTGTIDLSDLSTLILFLTVPGGVTIVDCP